MIIQNALNELKSLAQIDLPENTPILQKALRIAQFAHSAFTHNGSNQPSKSDPLTILQEAKSGAQFRCVEYSHLAAWLMRAYEIEARTVNIMMKDVATMEYGAGHVVVEFYEGLQHNWVMADIQAGVVAKSNGVLQSALELRETLNNSQIENFISQAFVAPSDMFGGNYKQWLQPYVYFIDRPPALNFEYSNDPEPHMILVPDGDSPPKFFQRTHKLDLVVVTAEEFYRIPD